MTLIEGYDKRIADTMKEGKIEFEMSDYENAIDSPLSYAIRGGDAKGMTLTSRDASGVLVLSNQ